MASHWNHFIQFNTTFFSFAIIFCSRQTIISWIQSTTLFKVRKHIQTHSRPLHFNSNGFICIFAFVAKYSAKRIFVFIPHSFAVLKVSDLRCSKIMHCWMIFCLQFRIKLIVTAITWSLEIDCNRLDVNWRTFW